MMKQEFYEMMDKYLTAMGIKLEDYGQLREATMKEFALGVAYECQKVFDVAWDVEETYHEDGTLGQLHVPDLDDRDLCGKLEAWREAREYQEYCFCTAAQMCKSILRKILFSCDGSVLTKAELDKDEKDFLIAYDFARGEFRKSE